MFKNIMSFDSTFITECDSLRTNYLLKCLILKNDFYELMKKNSCISPLIFLNFNICNPFNNIFLDKYNSTKSFFYQIVELETILKFLEGGTNNVKLRNFFKSIRSILNNFVVFFNNECFSISLLEYRKLLEAWIYIQRINKSNINSISEIEDIIDNKIINYSEQFKNEKKNDLLKTWADLSEYLHGFKSINDNEVVYEHLNVEMNKLLGTIILHNHYFVIEIKKLLYIFKEDNKIERFINLLDLFEEETSTKNLGPININFFNFKNNKEFIDKIFNNLKSYLHLWVSEISVNKCEYYNKNKDKINNLIDNINPMKMNRFNRSIGKSLSIPQKKFFQLFKIKPVSNNTLIYEFYLELLSNDHTKINWVNIDESFINQDEITRLAKYMVILNKEAYEKNNAELMVLCQLLIEFIFYHNLIEGYNNGLFTLIIEFIRKTNFAKNAINENLEKDIKKHLELNKNTRHFNNDSNSNNKRIELAKILRKICENIIKINFNKKIADIMEYFKTDIKIFEDEKLKFIETEKAKYNLENERIEKLNENEIVYEHERNRVEFYKILIDV